MTALTLSRFDTDGSPIMTGDTEWTVRARHPKNYQTPYGEVNVERNVYQTSRGGKIYVPLDAAARMVNRATPRFAKMLSNKYARFNANGFVSDLAENHGRRISKAAVQNVAQCVGAIAAVKEESWEYSTPKLKQAVNSGSKSSYSAKCILVPTIRSITTGIPSFLVLDVPSLGISTRRAG